MKRLACIALLLLVPSMGFARPHDEAVDEAAKARYAEGFRLYSKRRYEEARVAFLQASSLKRRPASLLMLALSSIKLERWLDASRELDAYLAEVGAVPPKLRAIVDGGRREVQSHIGKIRLDVPEGSEVTIDGERIASFDSPVPVVAGPHKVDVLHRDETRSEQVDVAAGATVDVKPSFAPKPLVPAADPRTKYRPEPARAETPATHGDPSLLAPPATTWPVYVAGAIGVGGLATAAIFGGLRANSAHAVDVANETLVRTGQSRATCEASSVEATYAETCLTLLRNEKLVQQHQQTFQTALIVGGAGMAFALGWFFFATKEHSEKAVLRVMPGLGGASVAGAF